MHHPLPIPTQHRSDEPRAGGVATSALDAPPPIDEETFARLRQLDPDGQRGFLRQLLHTYERSLERQLGSLDVAQVSGDTTAAGNVAHALKSSSASVGALDLSARCAAVERLARAGDAGALGASLQALRAEADRVRAAVQAMLTD